MPKNSQKKSYFILLTKYLDGTNQIFLIGRKSKNKAVKKGNFIIIFLEQRIFQRAPTWCTEQVVSLDVVKIDDL